MLGKIIEIKKNQMVIKLDIDVTSQASLVNLHVVFEDGKNRHVGQIIEMNKETATINILGEIVNNKFYPGFNKKPSFKALVRMINLEELSLIFGKQQITENGYMYLGTSTLYPNYRINVGVNNFFAHHFSVIGNTGSGKSFAVSRMIQNLFSASSYVPLNSNILIFDAYGEYTNAFSQLPATNPNIGYKTLTTNIKNPDGEILRIPLWLLDVDDLAILLGVESANQIPILEKALKLVVLLRSDNKDVMAHKNDIIARAILDILMSGKDSTKIRDQIMAVLTNFNTEELNLNMPIVEPGYTRTLKQCLYVDKTGKMQDMELVVDLISKFTIENLELKTPDGTVPYTLSDLEKAMDFALISEGILKSDKVFDYANILSVRLHSLASGEYSEFFNYPEMTDKATYISNLLTIKESNKKAQILNFNINYVDDRFAKALVKIISKLVFNYSLELRRRASFPFHIIIEEAHRYVQNDNDEEILGYNIFNRIAKEGRKYGVLLGFITQRPSELSETAISQCANFIILRTVHPKDVDYIRNLIPNISEEILEELKQLQPGTAMAFGSAFQVPIAIKFDRPNPEPLSNNADITKLWY